jgi:hypothetical protein
MTAVELRLEMTRRALALHDLTLEVYREHLAPEQAFELARADAERLTTDMLVALRKANLLPLPCWVSPASVAATLGPPPVPEPQGSEP